MIEKTVLDYLNENLDVPVYMEIPAKPDDSFVIVEKTGSGVENRIYSAMICIQSYAQTLLEAAELNEEVKALMERINELGEIGSCRLNSDYQYTNVTTKHYRYQAVYDIVHY